MSTHKKFVAYFDILGYGDRIKGKNIDEEYEIQKKFIKDTVEIIENNAKERADFHTIHFSDTHIFYTNDVSEDSFEIIIKSSLAFMSIASVCNFPYLPLRGAINYGDFMADHSKSIFIGEGLRGAYYLAERQEWMGCSLSGSCYEQVQNFEVFKEFVEKFVLVKYVVPVKEPAKIENKYVINMESFPRVWGKACKDMPLTDSEFIKNIFVNKGVENSNPLNLNANAIKKMKNTQDFFAHIRHLVEKRKQK